MEGENYEDVKEVVFLLNCYKFKGNLWVEYCKINSVCVCGGGVLKGCRCSGGRKHLTEVFCGRDAPSEDLRRPVIATLLKYIP